ncbi:MAG TPA: transposase, partial [Ktedonobacteraceae bacterium]
KTDIKDSEWLANLLRHGLLQASFIPPQPIRELRELTRYRKSLVKERTQEINRLQKTLEGANIKLASVVTDVLGVSGRAMLQAVASGLEDAAALAGLARGRLCKKKGELSRALEGQVQPHHRFLIGQILTHVDFLDEATEQVQVEIDQRLGKYAEEVLLYRVFLLSKRTLLLRSLPRSGLICHVFLLPSTSPPGRESRLETNRAQASGWAMGSPREIRICERC